VYRQAQAEDKRKCYVCMVWVSDPLTQDKLDMLNATQDMAIEQMTPVRVLHRRTLMTRTRWVAGWIGLVSQGWCCKGGCVARVGGVVQVGVAQVGVAKWVFQGTCCRVGVTRADGAG
jgi:hypothetical protein